MARTNPDSKTSRPLLIASTCIVVAALYFAQTVLIPLALSILLSFLIAPLVNRLERWKLRRVPSVLAAVTVVFGIIAVLGSIVVTQIYDLAKNVDQYEGNVLAKLEGLRPRSLLFEKWKHAASVVQERIDAADRPATTQSTQPSNTAAIDKAAAPIRDRMNTLNRGLKASTAARTGRQWTNRSPCGR